MQTTNRGHKLAMLLNALQEGNLAQAKSLASKEFPWAKSIKHRPPLSKERALRIFVRDRFTDRYSGSRLVFPGTLLALGRLMPEQFPIHKTWKAGESHEIFWELWPVVDHKNPVARGGSNEDDNLVTTSVTNNTAKGHAKLEELGLELKLPSGDGWDGLAPLCLALVLKHVELQQDKPLMGWVRAYQKKCGSSG